MKREPLKILMLEDSPADAEMVQRQLLQHGPAFTCKVVDQRTDFIKAIKTFSPHLILSDHSLPQFNSVEALKIARKLKPDIPFILVTGAVSDEFAVNIIKQGADDYILKDKLVRLPSAIKSVLKQHATEKARKQILEALIKSEQRLKEKVDELNMFIYKLSHDIRGPIATVKGLLQLANGEDPAEKPDNYLLMISKSIDKLDHALTTLINSVEKIESPLTITKIDLGKCIEGVCEQLKNVSGFDRIHFNVHISNDKPFYSDKEKLATVLLNIIENSIKYQNRTIEQPYVSILAENIENGIQLTIADNGVGIPERCQFQIFDMFTRANMSSTGSGLGLYIVKNAMEKLKGNIRLKSELEKGTTLSITLSNLKS